MSGNLAKLNATVQSALTYIDALIQRFEKAERGVEADFEQIQRRLQQLSELVRTVTTMQEQVGFQHKNISELRSEVKEQMAALEQLVEQCGLQNSDSIVVVSKKTTEALNKQSMCTRVIEDRVSKLEIRLQTWLNRGIGGWVVVALVYGIFQYVGLQYINNFQKERELATAAMARVATLEKRQSVLEAKLEKLTSQKPVSQKWNNDN